MIQVYREISVCGSYASGVLAPDIEFVNSCSDLARVIIKLMRKGGQPCLPLGHQALVFIAAKREEVVAGTRVVHVGALEHLRDLALTQVVEFKQGEGGGFCVSVGGDRDSSKNSRVFPAEVPSCALCGWPILHDDPTYVISHDDVIDVAYCGTCRDHMVELANETKDRTWQYHRFGLRGHRLNG